MLIVDHSSVHGCCSQKDSSKAPWARCVCVDMVLKCEIGWTKEADTIPATDGGMPPMEV